MLKSVLELPLNGQPKGNELKRLNTCIERISVTLRFSIRLKGRN
jgi:hypothetical protein